MRTLRRFLSASGKLPENFVVTLPKITVVEQIEALVEALEDFPAVRIDIMVEAPQILFMLPKLVEAARGRCVGANLGPYDYTASLGITATHQDLLHPACDFGRAVMQISLAGTGLRLVDGPTTLLPVTIHRGETLSEKQKAENRDSVHRAWSVQHKNIRHALHHGFYQGWDLHPAQIPVRYAAMYSFFLEGLEAASERLRNFIAAAAQATRVGSVFDDAATGQGLLNYFLRAVRCGAIPEDDVPRLTGLTPEQLRSGSFLEILKTR
jgi:citrate lyase beta subunit